MAPFSLANRAFRAFTLVEMIVALGIIGLVTAIVVSGQKNFDNVLTVTDTAYTVALSIREAQTFGLSSRIYNGTNNAAYGVHFAASNPGGYLLFADVFPVAPGFASAYCPGHSVASGNPDSKPGNCTYDSTQNELVQSYTFRRGFTISNICGHDSGKVQRCTNTGYLTGIDMSFQRPNTDSVVVGLTGTGNVALTDAQITLTSQDNSSRYICLTSVGEISVATSTCP